MRPSHGKACDAYISDPLGMEPAGSSCADTAEKSEACARIQSPSRRSMRSGTTSLP